MNADPRILKALDRAREMGEKGIAVAAYHRGELIVDAVAGVADTKKGIPADERTLFPVFSVTKASPRPLFIQAAGGEFYLVSQGFVRDAMAARADVLINRSAPFLPSGEFTVPTD